MGIKYTTTAIVGYNSSPPSDDGALTDTNKIKWVYHKTKLGDPLNAALLSIDTALVSRFDESAQAKATNYTTTVSDNCKTLECTGTITISLLDAATGAASYQVRVVNVGVGVVTVGRATAGNTINAVAQNWTLYSGSRAMFVVNATNNGYIVLSGSVPNDSVTNYGGAAGGTANALTMSVSPAITVYVAGQTFSFQVSAANTGAATLAVNGLAATAIVKESGAALASGDMPLGTVVQVTYNGTNFRLGRTTATSLTTLAVDANVVHTTGNESIAGVKTFTTTTPFVLRSTAAIMEGQSTAVGVTGYWRMFFPATDNTFTLLRNTAAAGDFSTNIAPLTLTSGGAATFLGTVTSANSPFGGRVSNNGTTAAFIYGPTGWTVARTSTGVVTVTHNLGSTSYAVTANSSTSANNAIYSGIAANSFNITSTINATGAAVDTEVSFTLVRN